MNLGLPVAVYERRMGHAWGAVLVLCIALIALAVPLAFIPWVGPLGTVGLLFLAGQLGYKTFVRGRVRLAVSERGFQFDDGRRPVEAVWADVQEVQRA